MKVTLFFMASSHPYNLQLVDLISPFLISEYKLLALVSPVCFGSHMKTAIFLISRFYNHLTFASQPSRRRKIAKAYG